VPRQCIAPVNPAVALSTYYFVAASKFPTGSLFKVTFPKNVPPVTGIALPEIELERQVTPLDSYVNETISLG
jgi:hypothetical protein